MPDATLSPTAAPPAASHAGTSPAGAPAASLAGRPAAAHSQPRLIRLLLGCGMIVGPLYVLVSLAQALARPGFDLGRHQWSLLENGDLGWIQVANFVVSGGLLVAYAAGMRRELGRTCGVRWAPPLTAAFGVCLVAAGIFTADPALGFPPGTPDGPGRVSWHGVLHLGAAGVGFVAIAATGFVFGAWYVRHDRRRFARFCRVTGVVFLAGFAAVASGAGSSLANLVFVGAVVLLWAWISAVALDLRRAVRAPRR